MRRAKTGWLLALLPVLHLSASFASLSCINNPCVYGICVEGQNGSYTCYCIDGFTGVNCQTNWDECWSSPCLNGGTCIDGIAEYDCSCAEGFVGEICEENIDECISNPCLNNGTCVDVANGYMCQCFPGYTGTNCETDMAVCNTTEEAHCSNGGTCIEGPGISFTCRCLPGYTGKNCETRVQLCGANICENKALCVIENKESVCYCVPDFHGDRCQYRYDECQKGPGCLNGGTCIDGVDSYSCSCPNGLLGRFCECIATEKGDLNCNYIRFPKPNTGLPYTPIFNTVDFEETSISSSQYPLSSTESTSYVPTNFSIHSSTSLTLPEYSTSKSIPAEHTTRFSISYGTESRTDYFSGSTPSDTTYETSEITSWSTDLITYGTGHTERTTYNPIETTEPVSEITSLTSEVVPSISSEGFTYETTTGETFRTDFTSEVPQETSFMDKETKEQSGIPTEEAVSTESSVQTTEGSLFSLFPTGQFSSEVPSVTVRSTSESSLPTSEVWTGESTSTEFYVTDIKMTSPIESYTESTTVKETTCKDDTCENGGTCYEEKTGIKCQCTFGWTGKFCDEEEGINIAAFKGRSYLLHILGNATKATISFKLRTLADTGLLIFAHVTSNMYMSLFIQHGLLKFQFSCGVQTMLFSELKYPINTGYEMDISATLELLHENELQKCAGTVRLNGTLSMTGKQEAFVPNFGTKATGIFYIGGLPLRLLKKVDIPVKTGVTACIHSLVVNGFSRFIYSDAEDGYDISECASLACLSSPCSNGATCIEKDQQWSCLCPSGFTGRSCQRSICLNNPCKYGGTCATYPGSGFLCLCPLGKHGMYCEQDLDIGQTQFSASVDGLSSYTAYPLPGAIHHSFELWFSFIPTTFDQISLMIFIGQGHPHDTSSDHLAVSFIHGYVVLTWNLGSGPRRIFTPNPVLSHGMGKQPHHVKLGRSGQDSWLQVDKMPNVTGTSPGYLSQLNARPIIYIGGYETRNFTGLPHDLPLHTGFSGCLFNVELRAGKMKLSLQRSHRAAVGRNVGQCSTKHCHNSTCLHSGVCIDHGATFTCLCQDGWFGPTCGLKYNPCDSSRHNCSHGATCVPLEHGYECDCPFGKTGKYCENEETLSDIGFSGQRSYISLPPASLDLDETCIDLEIRPVSSNGLVLYSSQTQSQSTTFISLSLHGGVLELKLLPLGGGQRMGDVLEVRSGRVLPLGEWTRVRAGRYGRRIFLWVDGLVNAGTLLPGEALLPSHSPLYIGGLPDLSEIAAEAVTRPPVPFSGCVRRVRVNWRAVPLDVHHVISARNVHDCDGTACGGDICFNGGSCFLTPENKPNCKCAQHYMGERCDKQSSCDEAGCENNGRCIKFNKDFKCQCPVGWTGPFCNVEVPLGIPHFGGDGFLKVDTKHAVTKRGGPLLSIDPVVSYLYLNFSTALHDSLILWTSQEDQFFGVGLENGLIKVAWGKRNGEGRAVLLPGALVSDGAWHTLTTSFENGRINLATDKAMTHSYSSNLPITTNGIFYLGGFPHDKKVYTETLGHFQSPFSGCIREMAWNRQYSVVDFTKFTGENLGSCDLYYPPKDLEIS